MYLSTLLTMGGIYNVGHYVTQITLNHGGGFIANTTVPYGMLSFRGYCLETFSATAENVLWS